jgi:hypothetical protein
VGNSYFGGELHKIATSAESCGKALKIPKKLRFWLTGLRRRGEPMFAVKSQILAEIRGFWQKIFKHLSNSSKSVKIMEKLKKSQKNEISANV